MVNTKKVSTRQCIVCGFMKEKKDLVRLVKTPERELEWDFTGKKNGRGAYICKNGDCLDKAFIKKAFNRSFKMTLTTSAYDRLSEELKNIEN